MSMQQSVCTKLRLYSRLMRLDKPVGILLLWFPTVWALWLAHQGVPPVRVFCYFLLGTVVMRSAGCVINDFADRHIDKHVTRTKLRPLTTGAIHSVEAMALLSILLLMALFIVVQLPPTCFYLACFGVVITVIYPFCKRWIQAPQLVLSMAFSVGIPMAYVVARQPFDQVMWVLIVMNLFWVIAYDTMYAWWIARMI